MILDSLNNSAKYEGLHPSFKQAFDFIKSTDFSKLEPGKIELDGDNLFVNLAELTGKKRDEAKLETHNAYIDIQMPLTAIEEIGWKPLSELQMPMAAYDAKNDITFFEDAPTAQLSIRPGQFAIFFPEDGHQPGIGDGIFRKIIVKIKL